MKFVFTPDWFLGSDVLIEFISFLVLATFFILSYKSYRLSKNKKTLNLGLGFLLIALAELATIFTKLVLYYDTSFTQVIGHMAVTYNVVKSVDVFYYFGFFFHKLLTLLGLYVIYRIPVKKRASSEAIFVVYFIIISSFFSNAFYYIFHLTTLIFLIFIIGNYLEIYKKNKYENTKILIISFFILALSHTIFILSKLQILYVVGQTIQLVSYLMLLFLAIRILRAAKNREKSGFWAPRKSEHY